MFLSLRHATRTHDTFARVFAKINPQQFQECFSAWIKSVAQITDGEIIAIDGKKLKHSYDKQVGHAAINLVSAWATSNRLVLSQTKVNNKSFRYYSNKAS